MLTCVEIDTSLSAKCPEAGLPRASCFPSRCWSDPGENCLSSTLAPRLVTWRFLGLGNLSQINIMLAMGLMTSDEAWREPDNSWDPCVVFLKRAANAGRLDEVFDRCEEKRKPRVLLPQKDGLVRSNFRLWYHGGRDRLRTLHPQRPRGPACLHGALPWRGALGGGHAQGHPVRPGGLVPRGALLVRADLPSRRPQGLPERDQGHPGLGPGEGALLQRPRACGVGPGPPGAPGENPGGGRGAVGLRRDQLPHGGAPALLGQAHPDRHGGLPPPAGAPQPCVRAVRDAGDAGQVDRGGSCRREPGERDAPQGEVVQGLRPGGAFPWLTGS